MNIEVFIFNIEKHDNSYFEKLKQLFLEQYLGELIDSDKIYVKLF